MGWKTMSENGLKAWLRELPRTKVGCRVSEDNREGSRTGRLAIIHGSPFRYTNCTLKSMQWFPYRCVPVFNPPPSRMNYLHLTDFTSGLTTSVAAEGLGEISTIETAQVAKDGWR